jgi:predicted O-methyltransferase YrrM
MSSIVIPHPVDVLRKIRYYFRSIGAVRAIGACCDINRSIELVFSSDGGFLRPLQRPSEIQALLGILADRKPKIVVEIGTASGGNLFLFTRVAAGNARIISIDLPAGRFGGGYPGWRIPLYLSFARPRQTIHLIRADSHAQETFARLAAILKGEKIDFLFIDGDHTRQGVLQDFTMYHPLVHPDGIVAFHDIVKHPPGSLCDVNYFWEHIKARFHHMEIVEDWSGGFAGIGLIISPGRSVSAC